MINYTPFKSTFILSVKVGMSLTSITWLDSVGMRALPGNVVFPSLCNLVICLMYEMFVLSENWDSFEIYQFVLSVKIGTVYKYTTRFDSLGMPTVCENVCMFTSLWHV